MEETREHYMTVIKQFHSLYEKIEKEIAFLELTGKTTSNKLLRLHADIVVIQKRNPELKRPIE
jgi:hypothetical protein